MTYVPQGNHKGKKNGNENVTTGQNNMLYITAFVLHFFVKMHRKPTQARLHVSRRKEHSYLRHTEKIGTFL